MNPLQGIPAKVRAWAYWISYALGNILGSVSVAWAVIAATTSAEMPLWLAVTTAVVLYAQAQLNQIAGVNVTPDTAPAPDPDEDVVEPQKRSERALVAQPAKPRRRPPPREKP